MHDAVTFMLMFAQLDNQKYICPNTYLGQLGVIFFGQIGWVGKVHLNLLFHLLILFTMVRCIKGKIVENKHVKKLTCDDKTIELQARLHIAQWFGLAESKILFVFSCSFYLTLFETAFSKEESFKATSAQDYAPRKHSSQ